VCGFLPVRVSAVAGHTQSTVGPTVVKTEFRSARPNALVFHITNSRYQQILASCLKNLLAELGR
jgi:hypothetical protein